MARTEGEGRRSKLPTWDDVPKTPGPIPGTHGYSPLPVPSGGGAERGAGRPSGFIERLSRLTPYEMPVATEPAPVEAASSAPASRAGQPQAEAEQDLASLGVTRAVPQTVTTPKNAELVEEGRRPAREEVERTRKVRGRTYQMSWEEYNKLSDEQRAAVDFNTLLLQAREKDLSTEYKPSPEEREEYEADLRAMFGEERGSETYAPETLGVLRQVDFRSTGEDLDDFLGLKAAVSAKELQGFDFERKLHSPELRADPEAERVREIFSPSGAGGLATEQRAGVYTQNLRRAMARAGELIQNFSASAAATRGRYTGSYGGTPNEVAPALGFGDDEDSAFFRMAADALSRDLTDEELNLVWSDLDRQLDAPKMKAFLRFADDITRDSLQSGVPSWTRGKLPNGEPIHFRPELIRQRLGFDQGGNDAR